jgi:quercetin dioxygenase-like cupin family protein
VPLLLSIFVSALLSPAAHAAQVTELQSRRLSGIPGKEGTMILVEYEPGDGDPIHRHDASVFVYVLEGTIIMQVQGSERVTLRQGDTYFEGQNDVHLVSKNASSTETARFVAVLVKNVGAPILTPVE